MQRFIPRRPSGAMLVAFMALFVALGGSATALKGRNGVKKDDIVRGAVGTSEAANNSLRTQDVRNRTLLDRDHRRDGLTGSSIRESSLGIVPTANNAVNAANANRAGSAGAVDTQRRIGPVRLSQGQEQVLDTRGPFRILARCEDEADDDIEARLVLLTSQDNTAAVTDWDTDDPDFDVVNELEVSNSYSSGAGAPEYNGFYNGWQAMTPDGNTVYTGERSATAARVGGADCYFMLYPVF